MHYRTVRLSEREVREGHDKHGSKPLFGIQLKAVVGCLWTCK